MFQPLQYIRKIQGKKKMPAYAFAEMINEFIDDDGMIDLDLTVREIKKAMKGIWRREETNDHNNETGSHFRDTGGVSTG